MPGTMPLTYNVAIMRKIGLKLLVLLISVYSLFWHH
jgi:hypothetical protein